MALYTESDLKIEKSNGRGKYGATTYYIRPNLECSNRSRKVSGFTYAEIEEKKQRLISKWYAPMLIYYEIEGWTIGSNSKENALKEYWKICDLKDKGKIFEVKLHKEELVWPETNLVILKSKIMALYTPEQLKK